MMRRSWCAIVVGILLLAGCGSGSATTTIHVFAAASLTESFTALGAAFESSNPGVSVAFNFGGSNMLRTQIEQGAQADVFASANQKEMTVLVDGGAVSAEAVQTFAYNRLIVIYPNDNPGNITTLHDLAQPKLKLVVADPGVPVGGYTQTMLDALTADPAYGASFKQQVNANIVSRETNVKQVAAKVRLGEADAGIVYATDVTPDLKPLVASLDVPDQFNQIATYPIGVLKAGSQQAIAATFVDFVLSDAGQQILQSFGFRPRK